MGNYKNSFFDDSELATPLHDKMVLWAFDNAEKIIKDLGFIKGIKISKEKMFSFEKSFGIKNSIIDGKWCYGYCKSYAMQEYFNKFHKEYKEKQEIISALIDFFEMYDNAKLNCGSKKIIEYPLLARNGFNLGFVDLFFRIDCEYCSNYLSGLHYEVFIENCESIMLERASYQSYSFVFEIKPVVKSIGETLRQFQFYQSHLDSNTKLILVTKTKGLKEIFEGQGFYVVEYEDNQEFDF